MSEQPPQDPALRLPYVYTSPDQTVGEVGARPLPSPESVRRPPGRPSRNFGPVTRVVINQALMQYAAELADGDFGRLVPRADGSVIVANNQVQARRILGSMAFGAVDPSRAACYVEDLPS